MPGAANDDGQGGVRSLNLSVACALVSYEAGRQIGTWWAIRCHTPLPNPCVIS